MTIDLSPGRWFPDIELDDHAGNRRHLSELAGTDPIVLQFFRGWWCPKEQGPGARRAAWQVTLPPRRHLVLDERGIPTGEGERQPATGFEIGGRSFDDGYDGLASHSAFCVTGGGRTLTVELESGYPAAQVFSPHGKEFICFEPMTAPTNALRSGVGLRRVAPGDTFAAAFSIAVA